MMRRPPPLPGSWQELVAPIVRKCDLATTFEQGVYFNQDGARALGEILQRMAVCLDQDARCMDNAEAVLLKIKELKDEAR